MVAAVLRRSHNLVHNEGLIHDADGEGYLFRLTKFALGEGYGASILLLAAENDFVQNVRRLQFRGSSSRSSRVWPSFRSSGCSAARCRAP